VEEVQVEQTWEDALHRLADMSKEMPDLFVALSKRLEPRDLASIVQMTPDKAPQLLKSLNPRLIASVFEHLDPAISAEGNNPLDNGHTYPNSEKDGLHRRRIAFDWRPSVLWYQR
jgi:hypothetical protein